MIITPVNCACAHCPVLLLLFLFYFLDSILLSGFSFIDVRSIPAGSSYSCYSLILRSESHRLETVEKCYTSVHVIATIDPNPGEWVVRGREVEKRVEGVSKEGVRKSEGSR